MTAAALGWDRSAAARLAPARHPSAPLCEPHQLGLYNLTFQQHLVTADKHWHPEAIGPLQLAVAVDINQPAARQVDRH